MKDPYEILDVSRNATDDEIKETYRALAQKYSPDNYDSSPLADLAREKMEEIDKAYDAVMEERREQRASGQQQDYDANGYQYQQPYNAYNQNASQFSDIRKLINNGRLADAEELLNGVPLPSRDAEWHFLKGSIFHSKGYIDEAFQHFKTAAEMNPNNPEYSAVVNRMRWQRNGNMPNNPYGTGRQGGVNYGCGVCDICSGLILADCCCNCMGGDLIGCC